MTMKACGTMVRRAVGPLMRALCVVLIAGSMAGGAHAAGTTFADPLNRFSFTLPDGWQMQSGMSDNADFLFADAADNAAFDISVQPKPEEGALADVTQALSGIASLSPQYQADPAGVQDVMIGGVPAKSFAYTAQADGGTNATTRVYVLLHKNTFLYQITLTALPEKAVSAATATKSLLDSWKFA